MKTSKTLFFTIITIFGIMFAIFAVMAESVTTPSFEVSDNPSGGPKLEGTMDLSTTQVDQNESITFSAKVADISGVDSVIVKLVNSNEAIIAQVSLNDAGGYGDVTSGDGIFSRIWNIGTQPNGTYFVDVLMTDNLGNSNMVRISSTLTIVGAPNNSCIENADCIYDNTVCCNEKCVYESCQLNSDCIRCTDNQRDPTTGECLLGTETGTCDTSTCPNSCDYTSITCTVDADCGSGSFDACCNGDCTSHECNSTADCTAQPGGSCNVSVCPNICEYTTDTTPPIITIDDPLDAASDPNQPFTTDTILVKVTATDSESGIDKVEFEVDGSMIGQQTVDQSYSGYPDEYWLTIPFLNGSHQLIATAYDGAGNVDEDTINLEFLLTSNAPVIDLFSTDKLSYASTEGISVTLNAHDDDSNISLVNIYSSKGGGPISQSDVSTPTLNLTTGIGASLVVDWGNAFDRYAVRQDNYKLPFIKIAHAADDQNCVYIDTNYNRYIYAMVADATNPATRSNNVNLVITVTTQSCSISNSSLPPSSGSRD